MPTQDVDLMAQHSDFKVFEIVRTTAQRRQLQDVSKDAVIQREPHEPSSRRDVLPPAARPLEHATDSALQTRLYAILAPMAVGQSHGAHSKRQAIVIIHGLGEQRPLGTLKSFVRSFRKSCTFYSKPERITQSFEARPIKLRKLGTDDDWIETDFYEYYWAHLMFGERWRHLLRWVCTRAASLFFTADEVTPPRSAYEPPWQPPSPPHPQLRRLRAIVIRLAIVIAAVVFLSFAFLGAAAVLLLLLVLLLFAAIEWMSEGNALRIIGDVSRYLDVAPVNIERRHEILKGGIDLLCELHARRSDFELRTAGSDTAEMTAQPHYVYDRVVVVGHSLGSIIGYEILKHYWARVNRYLTFDRNKIPPSVTELAGRQRTSEGGIDGRSRAALADNGFRDHRQSADVCVNSDGRVSRGL
jgi:hypothetical protein